jgi:hypothetical protein
VFRKFGQSHCEYGPQQSVAALSNEYPEVVESAESKLTGTIFPNFMVAICAGASACAVEVVPGSEASATAPESKMVAAEVETAATTRFFFVCIYAQILSIDSPTKGVRHSVAYPVLSTQDKNHAVFA